jgi:hypothetical protein
MPDCEQEPKNSARKNSSKSLAECAREAEHEWRVKLGLSKGLHRRGNAFARERRRRAECPNEPKAAVRYRRYRKKQLGKFGAASEVRRIDPAGEVI